VPIATFRHRAIEIEIADIGQKYGLAAPQSAIRFTQCGMKADRASRKAAQFDAARHVNHGVVWRYHDPRPLRLLWFRHIPLSGSLRMTTHSPANGRAVQGGSGPTGARRPLHPAVGTNLPEQRIGVPPRGVLRLRHDAVTCPSALVP
jgi:hypothetical protein